MVLQGAQWDLSRKLRPAPPGSQWWDDVRGRLGAWECVMVANNVPLHRSACAGLGPSPTRTYVSVLIKGSKGSDEDTPC